MTKSDLTFGAALLAFFATIIAAVVLEPIAGNMNFVRPSMEFIGALRELCTRHGALLIFDEVMTGFRLSRGGAQEVLGVRPDLSCFGKVIGGGLPVGAVGQGADGRPRLDQRPSRGLRQLGGGACRLCRG